MGLLSLIAMLFIGELLRDPDVVIPVDLSSAGKGMTIVSLDAKGRRIGIGLGVNFLASIVVRKMFLNVSILQEGTPHQFLLMDVGKGNAAKLVGSAVLMFSERSFVGVIMRPFRKYNYVDSMPINAEMPPSK